MDAMTTAESVELVEDETESVELIDASELDLPELWHDWRRAHRYGGQFFPFCDHLRSLVSDPDTIDDELAACENCSGPNWRDDMRFISSSDDYACEQCVEWYYCQCEACEETVRTGDTNYTVTDARVCSTCLDYNYSYCEDCDAYYHNDYADEHEHEPEGMGCCESPALAFIVRNDGEAPLAQDTRVTITLPAGEIDAEGIETIRRFLRNFYPSEPADLDKYWSLSYSIGNLGNKWQTKEGNFTKRLSRYAYKELGLKLPSDVISHIGNVASAHSVAVDFAIETSRDLNMSAEDWYHEDSCWWQSYYYSRCTLKTNGGYGIRSFDDRGNVTGRVWVLPLRRTELARLVPTFDTETPDACAVFNGYGALQGYSPARIVAHMQGWTYRKINFSFGNAFINGGSAYLVAPEEIATQYDNGSLVVPADQHSHLYESEHANVSI